MNITTLLEKGYFPEELPPPFQTNSFATKQPNVSRSWVSLEARLRAIPPTAGSATAISILERKFKESVAVRYSVRRYGYLRREISIPNPFHRMGLSMAVADNWSEIETVFARSKISSSSPFENPLSERAVDRKLSFGLFLEACVIGSFSRKYELSTDLSRFYPTLYTHAIPWAIHGKAFAKANINDRNLLGNKLDFCFRNGNSRQTFGIPIGPDTSLIIAELVLCSLDTEIQKILRNLDCIVYRYMDDYRIYAKSRGAAENALRQIQKVFAEYELRINENKTDIAEMPCPFIEEWTTELRRFEFSINRTAHKRAQISKQRRILQDFASAVLKYTAKYPDKWVPRYGIEYLQDITLFDENWDIYSGLLYKLALVEPSILPRLGKILVSNRRRVNKSLLRDFLNTVVEENVSAVHHFEVAWSLWLFREFDIKVKDSIAEEVFNSSDVISKLIALHLKAIGLINPTVSTIQLETQLTPDSLMTESWLLTYEAMNKGWVGTPRRNPNNLNEFFKILRRQRVSFYDETRRIQPRSLKLPASSLLVVGSNY